MSDLKMAFILLDGEYIYFGRKFNADGVTLKFGDTPAKQGVLYSGIDANGDGSVIIDIKEV